MKTRQKRSSVISELELDMTSLIDCIFLLLIFFMVTTVFIDVQGLVIDLPGPSDSSDEQQQKKNVNIQITANGYYIVAGEQVPSSELAITISDAMEEFNSKDVIIHGDPESEHGFIVFAMDMATGAGAEQLAFAIEQAEEE